MESYEIRPMEESQAAAVSALIGRVLMEVNIRDYPREALEEFACYYSPERVASIPRSGGHSYVAMLREDEDPIQDYAQMYVVDASENPDDYIDGYYRYMDRMGEYQYQGAFYAATDGAQAYFVPTRSLDGDLYGVSPYSSGKLMNKNGYVVPVTFEQKGRYGVWIDLQAHTYSIWPLEIDPNACTEPLWMSGTGFSFGDWGSSDEMIQTEPYHYEVETEITDYTGDRQYYFYTNGWARVFRADTEGNWWFESAEGSCVIFDTDYRGPVRVTFDTASPWGTIKKITE